MYISIDEQTEKERDTKMEKVLLVVVDSRMTIAKKVDNVSTFQRTKTTKNVFSLNRQKEIKETKIDSHMRLSMRPPCMLYTRVRECTSGEYRGAQKVHIW